MSSQAHPLLQTHGLSVGYRTPKKGVRVLAENLELSMHSGQLICLLGPNGVGKSTLIRTLSGLQPALSGRVEICGQRLAALTPAGIATRLSMVLTEKVQAGNLDAYTVISLGRSPYTNWKGTLDETDREKVAEAIRMTRTGPLASRKIHELSDGEHQRIMLARALAQDTPLVILDEPTAYLDLSNRIFLMRMLHGLTRHTRKAILLSTHDLELALQTADQLWILTGNGQLLQGIPEDLVLNGSFEAAFVSEGFHFDRQTGAFTIRHEGSQTVQVTGNGLAAGWTRRALLRRGYRVTETASSLHVHVTGGNDETQWILRTGSREIFCSQIAEVLTALEKANEETKLSQ